MRGENVGITPRRSRSTVLQAQHQQQPVSTYPFILASRTTFVLFQWGDDSITKESWGVPGT